MKVHKNSRNAIAGLLAVAGSLTIGGFIIKANAKPPWGEFGSDVLCAFPGNTSLSLREIIQTYREGCDQLATDADVYPPYAVGIIRPVDPCAAGEVGPAFVCPGPSDDSSGVRNCAQLLDSTSNSTTFDSITSGQIGCFGAGVRPILNLTAP
jgi:hypothetical protein